MTLINRMELIPGGAGVAAGPSWCLFFFKFINVFFSFYFVFLTFGQAKSRPNDRPIPYTNIECGK